MPTDALPSGVEGSFLPIHQLAIVALGVRLFDNLDLEALAEEAARQNRWEFMLTAAPIPVEGGARLSAESYCHFLINACRLGITAAAFEQVVRQGALSANGIPPF